MGRYINPFTDWGFKRLFGQEFSKDLLINFLNDLFEGEFQIKDVTFKDKEQLGDTNDLRGCIFDIYCVTDDDKHFIVEMQNRWVPFFVNRSIYYASKAFVAQRKKFDEAGVRTAILYQFVPVYVVCIMNFMPKEHEVTKFRTDVALREKSSDSMFSDKLRFIYLSLPFFAIINSFCINVCISGNADQGFLFDFIIFEHFRQKMEDQFFRKHKSTLSGWNIDQSFKYCITARNNSCFCFSSLCDQ